MRTIDPDTLEGLEEVLLMADVGVSASRRIVDAVAERQRRGESLRQLVREEILRVLDAADVGRGAPQAQGTPRVILIVGVNGTGKTTTVGKLANQMKREGLKPLICAADTFRAAAVDQLQVWADRAGVDIVRAREGSDPAAVVFDALTAGRARGRDVILVDTAGRLHTRANLMQELEKIRRIASREVTGAPHETLLVLDATVGQNGLGAGARVHERGRRHRHRPHEARWHGQGRHGRGDCQRPAPADSLRRRGRGHRRSAPLQSRGVRRRAVPGEVVTDADLMQRALFHAARAAGATTPNPMVGAVVVSPDGSSSGRAGIPGPASRMPKCWRSTRPASGRAAAPST